MPTYEPCLMSASVALETPNTVTLSVRLIFTSPSLSDFTDNMRPLKFSTVPETRTAGSCCARVVIIATTRNTAAESIRQIIAILTSQVSGYAQHTLSSQEQNRRAVCPSQK